MIKWIYTILIKKKRVVKVINPVKPHYFQLKKMDLSSTKIIIISLLILELCQNTFASSVDDDQNNADANRNNETKPVYQSTVLGRNTTLLALSTKDMSTIFQKIFADYDSNVLPSENGAPLKIRCGIYINDMVPVESIDMVSLSTSPSAYPLALPGFPSRNMTF